jgi:penicillin-binding protein 1C
MSLFPARRAVFFLLLLAGCAASQPAMAAPTFREVRAAYVESDAWLLARDGRPLQSKRIDMKARRLPWTRIEDVSPALLRALLVPKTASSTNTRASTGAPWR